MMAARRELPVSEVLFLFFTGRGGSFLSPKEKEKNGAQIGQTGPPAPAWCSENKKGRNFRPFPIFRLLLERRLEEAPELA